MKNITHGHGVNKWVVRDSAPVTRVIPRFLCNRVIKGRLAPNPLFRVSSHCPLLHPPSNSFWYRIGTLCTNLGTASELDAGKLFNKKRMDYGLTKK